MTPAVTIFVTAKPAVRVLLTEIEYDNLGEGCQVLTNQKLESSF